ncbi:YcaO-like family protein [Chromobacterium sp. IIBBL 290-4]|uniref:YcaO-like family protein n=1 Tax=Chromobacterium sp. IIBBL 290-4 TaxID=2953890 RepID=UPI0020B8F2DE|nr:YcaO-like family protein [Chromobacterium sp. IIBBL 290-4]UTH74197.1 YcaO-like family protein [Chromobacterium sp. IIBBL 290-4]
MSEGHLQLCPRYLMVKVGEENGVPNSVFHDPNHVAYEDLVLVHGAGDPPSQPLPQDPFRPSFLSFAGREVVLMQTDGRKAIEQALEGALEFPIVWSGESEEGFHIGPVFAGESDVQAYLEVLARCRPLAEIESLVGWREVPTSAGFWVRHPQRLEAAVVQLLDSADPCRTAVLLESGRTVALGWPTDLEPLRPTDTADLHAWSKGVLYGADDQQCDELGICHRSALVPHIQPDELAVCSGKGSKPAAAAIRLIGECVERLSAWGSAPCVRTSEKTAKQALSDEHWHVERIVGVTDQAGPEVEVVNLLDSSDRRLVPHELVVLGPFDAGRRFRSDTTGLAAHTSLREAHRTALYECIERHNFYPGITHLASAVRCAELEQAFSSRRTHTSRGAEYQALVFTYPERLHAPVAHCFVFDHLRGLWTRGTGSGISMEAAAEAAYIEAAQLLLRLSAELHGGDQLSLEYQGCVDPVAFHLLHGYLMSQPTLSLQKFERLVDATDLETSLGSLRDHGYSAYVYDFPKIFSSWWACRVIVPDFARSQSGSSPVGRTLIGDHLPFVLPF